LESDLLMAHLTRQFYDATCVMLFRECASWTLLVQKVWCCNSVMEIHFVKILFSKNSDLWLVCFKVICVNRLWQFLFTNVRCSWGNYKKFIWHDGRSPHVETALTMVPVGQNMVSNPPCHLTGKGYDIHF
jgi:hypothetical protein